MSFSEPHHLVSLFFSLVLLLVIIICSFRLRILTNIWQFSIILQVYALYKYPKIISKRMRHFICHAFNNIRDIKDISQKLLQVNHTSRFSTIFNYFLCVAFHCNTNGMSNKCIFRIIHAYIISYDLVCIIHHQYLCITVISAVILNCN